MCGSPGVRGGAILRPPRSIRLSRAIASLRRPRPVYSALTLVGLMWFAGDRPYFAALGRIPVAQLWFALGELAFYFACLFGYRRLSASGRRPSVAVLLAIAGASNLMLHFPPLFAVVSTMSTRPLPDSTLERADWYRWLVDPEVVSRVVHVWLASFAATGLVVMWRALEKRADELHAATPRVGCPERWPLAVPNWRWRQHCCRSRLARGCLCNCPREGAAICWAATRSLWPCSSRHSCWRCC